MSAVLVYIVLAAGIAAAVSISVSRSRNGSACCGKTEKIKKTKPYSGGKHYPHEATALISGMMCENCAAKVQNALNGLSGISARVTIDGKKARIFAKDPVDEQAIRRAVHAAGYGVSGFTVVR